MPLARSWNNPPELQLQTDNIVNQGYDYTERAYKLKAANRNIQQINFTLQGSDNSPVFNPAFVIYNLTTDGLTLFVNDVPVTSKRKFVLVLNMMSKGHHESLFGHKYFQQSQ